MGEVGLDIFKYGLYRYGNDRWILLPLSTKGWFKLGSVVRGYEIYLGPDVYSLGVF